MPKRKKTSKGLVSRDLAVVMAIVGILVGLLYQGPRCGRQIPSRYIDRTETSIEKEALAIKSPERGRKDCIRGKEPKDLPVDDFVVEISAGSIILLGGAITQSIATTIALRRKLKKLVRRIRAKYRRGDTKHAQDQLAHCDAFDTTPEDQLAERVLIVNQLQENEVRHTVAMEKRRKALRKGRNQRKG